MIEKEPFRKYNEDSDDKFKVFSVKLNPEEQEQLKKDQDILQQVKPSTALKQLARIGSKVIHDRLYGGIVDEIIGNRRKNKRTGVVEFD